jgi:hypothetical protein
MAGRGPAARKHRSAMRARGATIPERRNRFPVVRGLPRPIVEIIYITVQEKHTSKQEEP